VVTNWRALLEAALEAGAGDASTRFFQLATVRADGRPAVRTVNFRGFLGPDGELACTTDLRSAKAEEVAARPWGEACWYFPETREQFRLAGALTLAGANAPPDLQEARDRAWAAASEAARQAYTWPQPGALKGAAPAFTGAAPGAPPPHFGLLLLAPEAVDYLDLRTRPHRRVRFVSRPDGWTAEEINP
jgi:PPOX class probable FMN-dependent enzyme